MVVIIHNRKIEDEIRFEVKELSDDTRKEILSTIHLRGWEDKDCWSEVL